jgi:hypothetical protein
MGPLGGLGQESDAARLSQDSNIFRRFVIDDERINGLHFVLVNTFPPKATLFIIAGRNTMYDPTQEVIGAELRLRGVVKVADMLHILEPGFASLLPYEIQRMKETGLVVYDEPLGPESVLRLP